MSFHWSENTLQTSPFQYLVGDICVKAVVPLLYKLAMCSLSLRSKRWISHAQSDFSSKQNTLRVALKPSKLTAPYYCSDRMRQHKCLWAILTGNFYVGNRQGFPSWAQKHWISCTFMEFVYLLNQEASNGLGAEFVNWHLYPGRTNWLYAPCPWEGKKDFSCSLRVLHKGKHIFSVFWGMENPYNKPGLREQEAAHGYFSWNCRRNLLR